MKNSKALVPGSFDPITIGHLNIIERAAKMFDTVYVTAFVNAQKTPRFKLEDKLALMRAACAHMENVRVSSCDGMLADYCIENEIGTVVKGARNSVDFEYEMKMAQYNRERAPELDTAILCVESGLEEISSSALYSLIQNDGDYERYVPTGARELLGRILAERDKTTS